MFQYNPEILPVEQFLASLKEKQKSTSSVGISNDGRGSPISSRTTTHPSTRNANPPRSRKKRKNRRSRSKRHKTSSQQPEDTVINLSNVQLSEAEIKLLSRGLTFVPTYTIAHKLVWNTSGHRWFRQTLTPKRIFSTKTEIFQLMLAATLSDVKESWTAPCCKEAALDTFITAVQQDRMSSQPVVSFVAVFWDVTPPPPEKKNGCEGDYIASSN